MNKIAIGTGIGLTVITVAILGIVYMDISTSGSRSEDGKTFNLAVTVGKESIEDGTIVTAIDENNDGKPIQLIAACKGEDTKLVSCTWIPLDKSKRTPEEQALAERTGKE